MILQNEDLGLNDINTADFETGVDHSAVILSDRVATAHMYVKGPDHPTVFAKGTTENDTTEGGVYFEGTPKVSAIAGAAVENDEPYYCQPPAGWSVVREEEDFLAKAAALRRTRRPSISLREFEDDSALTFTPYEEFSGARPGQVFRLGSQGLGYYQDTGGVPLA